MKIEFLATHECPHASRWYANLRGALGNGVLIHPVDLDRCTPEDVRSRYLAPTVLVNGFDLFGAQPSAEPLRIHC